MSKRVEKAEKAIAKALRAIQRAQPEIEKALGFADRVDALGVALNRFRNSHTNGVIVAGSEKSS